MPSNSDRKYQRAVSYIEDQIGADVNRGLLKVALTEQDIETVAIESLPNDEVRTRVYGTGPGGEKNELSVVQLDDAIPPTEMVQPTYLARALQSENIDELISRVTDSDGNQIDPLTNRVTSSVGGDSVRVATPSPIDVSASEVDVDLASQSLSLVSTGLEQISGQVQSAVDVADQIDKIQNILSGQTLTITDDGNFTIVDSGGNVIEEPLDVSDAVVTVTDDGSLSVSNVVSVQEDSPIDVSASEIDVNLSTQTVSPLTVTDDGGFNIVDSTDTIIEEPVGTSIEADSTVDYPNETVVGEDIIANGDLTIGPLAVEGTSALVVSANSADGNVFSVSLDWVDGSGNIYQEESASDLELASVSQDWSRVVRKAPKVEVTVTDESGATQNNVNVYVDTQE